MKTTLAVFTLAALLGQAPADFSGQWTAEPGAATGAGNMGSGWAPSITVSQSGTALVVEEMLFSRYDGQPPFRTMYALDGSESQNTVMPGHVTQMRVSRAKWDGAALVITTSYPVVDPISGKPITAQMTQRLALEGAGVLVIETSRAGLLGGKPTTAKTIYRKR